MCRKQFYVTITVYITLVLFFISRTKSDPLRAAPNPLNNNQVDVFLVADESNEFLNVMELGLLKTALNNIATNLNFAGTSPYFGVYFYGASSNVEGISSFPTTSASAVKLQLDAKQYTTAHSKPSTLINALNTVSSNCNSKCRTQAPRVTVVFAATLDSSQKSAIRELENSYGMTVIIVGVGSGVNLTNVNALASYPTQIYGMRVSSLFELILVAQHIASIVSDVPRQIYLDQHIGVSNVSPSIYYTVQLNTSPFSTSNETVVMFATSCQSCSVFGSLSQPNPISSNTPAHNNVRSLYAYSNYPNSLYYFRIQQNTPRFYVSILSNAASNMTLYADVFTLP